VKINKVENTAVPNLRKVPQDVDSVAMVPSTPLNYLNLGLRTPLSASDLSMLKRTTRPIPTAGVERIGQ